MSSAIDKIIAADPSGGGGNYFKDGHYPRLRVEKLSMKTGHNGESFIAEFRIIDAPVAVEPGVEPSKQGSTASAVWNFKHISAPGNIKALMLAVVGSLGIKEFNADVLRKATSDAQPFRGVDVEDCTYRKEIKSGPNAGKPITLHRWSPIEQTLEQLKAQRAELDAKPAPKNEPAPGDDDLAAQLAALGVQK